MSRAIITTEDFDLLQEQIKNSRAGIGKLMGLSAALRDGLLPCSDDINEPLMDLAWAIHLLEDWIETNVCINDEPAALAVAAE